MTIRSVLLTAYRRTRRSFPLLVFAWSVNLVLALILALPMMQLMNSSIERSMYDHTLRDHMDVNWWWTFKLDHEGSPIVSLLDYSIMGAGPFLHHADAAIRGAVVVPVVTAVSDAFLHGKFNVSDITMLTWIGLISIVFQTVLSAGFIATYRGDYAPTVAEFLSLGASWFGPMLRITIFSLLVYAVIVIPVVQGSSSLIASATAGSASERTPFLLYLGRDLVAFALLFTVSLWSDYARVRVVLDDRRSAAGAFIAAARWMASSVSAVFAIGLLLAGMTLVALFGFAGGESMLRDGSVPAIIVLLILQQVFMFVRTWIRATTYAAETELFQSSGMPS